MCRLIFLLSLMAIIVPLCLLNACPAGLFGPNCLSHCLCMNGAKCDPESGKCQCAPGWMGNSCEFPCPFGLFGQNCAEKCDCANGASCNGTNGECICLAGWMGQKCTEPCARKKRSEHELGSLEEGSDEHGHKTPIQMQLDCIYKGNVTCTVDVYESAYHSCIEVFGSDCIKKALEKKRKCLLEKYGQCDEFCREHCKGKAKCLRRCGKKHKNLFFEDSDESTEEK